LSQYDSIIIGAGHNGLVCAAYLAKAGQRVLVLEASDAAGGLAASREFHPGFKASVAQTVNHLSQKVVDELGLKDHGLELSAPALDTIGLSVTGDHVTIKSGSVSGVVEEDAANYRQLRDSLKKFSAALQPFWTKTMPGIGGNSLGEVLTFAQLGLKLRLLGKEHMLEFMRVATLPMRDLMDEKFDNDVLKAALSWDGLIGSKMAPRSPNHAVFSLLYRMCGQHDGMHSVPVAGMESLVNALQGAATAAGAEVRCGSPVKRITVRADAEGQRISGVELGNGELIEAPRVVSATDPQRTFLNLLGARHLEIEFTNRIHRLRCEGYVAKLHLALKGLPSFTGLDSPNGRMIIAPSMDAIEFAFDDAKYGHCSQNPVMECFVPSLGDPSLAGEGQHVLSANIMYVPANLKGGWSDAARDAVTQRVLAELETYAPGIRELVLHAELLTPDDLDQKYHVTGGHWHHTEFAVDQMLMMRPTYQAAQYSTPIPGLYLCGAGSHPGGGLTGAPGHNAAREILK
jgi:phytoene dehydrogenase-like protein